MKRRLRLMAATAALAAAICLAASAPADALSCRIVDVNTGVSGIGEICL